MIGSRTRERKSGGSTSADGVTSMLALWLTGTLYPSPMPRHFFLIVLLPIFLLSGCLPAIPAENFKAAIEVLQYPANKKLSGGIAVVPVAVADKVMGALVSENLTAALSQTIAMAGYAPTGRGPELYKLAATITKVEQPFQFFGVNVKVTIHYELSRIKDNVLVLSEDVTIAEEVGAFEGSDGTERLLIALPRAIRGNFTHFLRLLSIRKIEVSKVQAKGKL